MDIELRISPSQIEGLFRQISKKKYGKVIDFTPITQELSKLKQGGSLKYEHLEMISDPGIWTFSRWWRWPSREQIGECLDKTDGLFKGLNDPAQTYEEKYEKEKRVIEILFYDVFKHLELVSIILRFVEEDNYAIYSPPVAYIMNSPRGYSYCTEYINYLGEIRKYKEIYQLEKAAYVDMFLWAIEVPGNDREEILEMFHRDIKESNKKQAVKEIITKSILRKTDLEKSKFFFDIEEFNTAAKWAGCSFEGVLRDKCSGIQRTLGELVAEFPGLTPEKKKRIILLRNAAAHPSGREFSRKDVSFMIGLTEDISAG